MRWRSGRWRSGRRYSREEKRSPSMTRVLLVPDLPLERWPSMDRYAHRLYDWLESTDPGFEVRLAAHIGALARGDPQSLPATDAQGAAARPSIHRRHGVAEDRAGDVAG